MILRDGAPVFDRLGRWFTLVCVGFAPGDALPAAAARRGLPLAVLRLDDPEVAKVYGRGLLLVRPDQHIAWRGPACDDSRAADVVMARVLGWKRSGSVRIAQPPLGLLGTLRRLHNSGGGPGLANAPCWSLLIPPDGCVLGRSSE